MRVQLSSTQTMKQSFHFSSQTTSRTWWKQVILNKATPTRIKNPLYRKNKRKKINKLFLMILEILEMSKLNLSHKGRKLPDLPPKILFQLILHSHMSPHQSNLSKLPIIKGPQEMSLEKLCHEFNQILPGCCWKKKRNR